MKVPGVMFDAVLRVPCPFEIIALCPARDLAGHLHRGAAGSESEWQVVAHVAPMIFGKCTSVASAKGAIVTPEKPPTPALLK